jgi:DNA-directed RNA polymerase specialized sigma24 family protein
MATIADVDRSPGVVALAASGDEVAFARIVAAHHDDMVRVAYLVTGEIDLARDAVQSAWPITWRKLSTLRDPDLRRRRLREVTIGILGEGAEPLSGRLDDRVREVDLRNALLHLSPEDRGVVAMRYVLGLSSTEIGRATGLSPTGVRSRLARALERLRKELGDD